MQRSGTVRFEVSNMSIVHLKRESPLSIKNQSYKLSCLTDKILPVKNQQISFRFLRIECHFCETKNFSSFTKVNMKLQFNNNKSRKYLYSMQFQHF